ncbi:MAG: hypothetical protein A2161_04260 [Candidatus Schekmanbacteria bacterium RBG_13_48_7]|uniref:Uncharacterized protein n=1 Tax=Candidatus Schekmanbacteria bacterium RBG_13_48_7 TaxID=1817878 RepID=A0A1F7RN78_9BACT|nr:MAG: hypothetical protein A2161_04260 [Candidatus Schekmanbacteria bacterium RBG_13_48_7]
MMREKKMLVMVVFMMSFLFLIYPLSCDAQESPLSPGDSAESVVSASSSTGRVLYRTTPESLLEVRITTAKSFLNMAVEAFQKGNKTLAKFYLNRSHQEFRKFSNLFPSSSLIKKIDSARTSLEKNHLKTAISNIRSAKNVLSNLNEFGDISVILKNLEESLNGLSQNNVSGAIEQIDMAEQNIISMFMSVPERNLQTEDLYKNITSVTKQGENPENDLNTLNSRLDFLYSASNLLSARNHIDKAMELNKKNKIKYTQKEIRFARNALYKVMQLCRSNDLKSVLKNLNESLTTAEKNSENDNAKFGEELNQLSIQIHNISFTE